ncbi:protein eva-1 homolog C isoform X1 [Alosa sapidissima]|uniref:protein eva-1 homolog C isoform X1 n=2 Tax=Alosa sapidissima TaxID=34773 RepID=UPI001C08F5DF|nr:protein eva-1 homolog C isoform X1 [Alosa sapidissima]
MFFPDVSFSAINYALVLGLTCLTVFANFTKSSAEFSGYLSKVLRNYTEQACDGDFLSVRCPPRTTITVQSAFYGRRGPAYLQPCPAPLSVLTGAWPIGEETPCHVSTSLQKMQDECQDRRSCQVLVNSRLFGADPCPSTSKYLTLWYKCRPNEYKSKVVCEGERMRLNCKSGMQIAVYSAMFGRTQQGALECPPNQRRAPSVDCQSATTLQVLTSRCQGKQSCSIRASSREFGDPCYAGTRKYLNVIYTCVPKKLLQESDPGHPKPQPLPPPLHDLNVVGDSAPPDGTPPVTTDASPGKKKRERETVPFSEEKSSRPSLPPSINATALSADMALISSALATYTYIAEHTERAALYFVCGVCVGLFLTLFALVVQISCRTDCPRRPFHRPCRSGSTPANRHTGSRRRPSGRGPHRNRHGGVYTDSDSTDDSDDSDWDACSDLSARRHRRFERTLNTNVFTSAEELERAQRLEERERIIREIWMNGQPDVPGTRSLNRYY